MGNYLLCKKPLAAVPFYIESIHLNLYSIEELCYFLSTNMALADELILDSSLSEWLSEECGLGKTIREYDNIRAPKGKTGSRLYWIFAKSHYFTENELRRLKMRTEALDAMSPMELQKRKGDALIKFGKYKRCIECYEKVFEMDSIGEQPSFFRASVYSNMGCAYARLFQSAKAGECFKKAYETDPSEEFRDAYLKALYFDGGSGKLKEGISSLQIPEERETAIKKEIASLKVKEIPEEYKETLSEWVGAYHLGVDQ